VIQAVPGTASVIAERVSGGRYITIDIDRLRAARYGLNIEDVQMVVAVALGGENVTETVEGLERYPVNVRYPIEVRDSGREAALAARGRARRRAHPIGRRGRDPCRGGAANDPQRERAAQRLGVRRHCGPDLGSYVEEAKARVAAEVPLPTGYSIGWSGQYEYCCAPRSGGRWSCR